MVGKALDFQTNFSHLHMLHHLPVEWTINTFIAELGANSGLFSYLTRLFGGVIGVTYVKGLGLKVKKKRPKHLYIHM